MIDGVLRMENNTFARFFTNCTYGTYAIGSNPNSPDAVHPVNIIRTVKLNVQLSSLAYFYDPNPAWVNRFVSCSIGAPLCIEHYSFLHCVTAHAGVC